VQSFAALQLFVLKLHALQPLPPHVDAPL
jgi:hypothetical protein